MIGTMFEFLNPSLLGERILRIFLVLLGAYFAKKFLLKTLQKSLAQIDHGIAKEIKKERVRTLNSVLSNLFNFAISLAAFLIILSEFAINITPLLAGLGILGLGAGFASQTLVRDYISGFFILFENIFNVGDEIEVAGKKGEVVDLSMRTTTLKDGEGKIHIIPNSQIAVVTKETEETKGERET